METEQLRSELEQEKLTKRFQYEKHKNDAKRQNLEESVQFTELKERLKGSESYSEKLETEVSTYFSVSLKYQYIFIALKCLLHEK